MLTGLLLCCEFSFVFFFFFFFQAEDGIRDGRVTGVQTCALPISRLARGTGSFSAPPFPVPAGRSPDPRPRAASSCGRDEHHEEPLVVAPPLPARGEPGLGENPQEGVRGVLV